MKPQSMNRVLLTLAGTLLIGSALAAEVAVSAKSDKPAATERNRASEVASSKPKPAASPETARQPGRLDASGGKRQLEVPMSVMPPSN